MGGRGQERKDKARTIGVEREGKEREAGLGDPCHTRLEIQEAKRGKHHGRS